MMPETAPNRMVPKGKKDEDYHRRFGRYCVAAANTGVMSRMHAKMAAAERAYNDMIVTPEDVETFQLDASKNTLNRVFFVFNMMKPLVEQHRGTMLKSKFNASVMPVTHRTRTRKQIALAHQMLAHEAAMTSRDMKHIMSQKYNLGDSILETMGMFENSFQDEYMDALNHLVQQSAKIAFEGDDSGMEMMQYLFSGTTCGMFRPEGSFVRWRSFSPRNLIWDTSSERLDFMDAEWMGMRTPMGLTQIAESFPAVDRNTLSYIEDQIRMFSGFSNVASNSFPQQQFNNKLQVHATYWKDVAYSEFGYINGLGGVPTLVKVGYDEGDGKAPKYTKNDLIAPPDNAENRELFKGQRTRNSTYECTRFCEFVPWEYIMGPARDISGGRPEDLPDLVLDWGLYDLQGYNPLDPMKTANPIRAYRYAVADGETVTPVQATIDPNRFAIRILSAIEGQMNNSGSKGTIIDTDMLHPSMPTDTVDARIKSGESIHMQMQGKGVAQAVANYDNTPSQGTYAMMNMVSAIENLVRTVNGTPAAIQEPQKNQTTGVTEMVTANASLMHEAIYDGYQNLQLQKWRFLATAGKEYYLERPDVLWDLIDERDYMPLLLTDEIALERLNAKVDRDNPDEVKRQQVNAWLDQLFQLGVIPLEMYADLYNNSYFEDVSKALRLYAAQLKQAQNEAAKQEQKQMMQDGLAAKQMQLEQEKKEVFEKEHETATKLADTAMKSDANERREVLKAEVAPPKAAPKAKASA